MYTFKENINKSAHDAFVQAHPLCNLLQSSAWAKVKDNWEHHVVGVYDDDTLIASALVLKKALPLHLTMMYIPRGPIMDYNNTRLVSFFMQELKVWAKGHHCLFITFDPPLHCNDYTLAQANEERYEEVQDNIRTLQTSGAIFKGFTKDIDATIQPRYHANVYNSEAFSEDMNKNLKKGFASIRKKNIRIEGCHIEGIDEFCKVMRATEVRKNIVLRDNTYFTKLMNAYKEDAIIFLAHLPLKELLAQNEERLATLLEDRRACPENAKKKLFVLEENIASVQREVNELQVHHESEGDTCVIAGAMCVKFGATAEILYAGMDDRFKRYMAPNGTFFACMKWSFEQGCTWSNMGGIEGTLKGGLTAFKSNFNPIINEFVGEFDLPVNTWLYKASQIAYNIRKKRK